MSKLSQFAAALVMVLALGVFPMLAVAGIAVGSFLLGAKIASFIAVQAGISAAAATGLTIAGGAVAFTGITWKTGVLKIITGGHLRDAKKFEEQQRKEHPELYLPTTTREDWEKYWAQNAKAFNAAADQKAEAAPATPEAPQSSGLKPDAPKP